MCLWSNVKRFNSSKGSLGIKIQRSPVTLHQWQQNDSKWSVHNKCTSYQRAMLCFIFLFFFYNLATNHTARGCDLHWCTCEGSTQSVSKDDSWSCNSSRSHAANICLAPKRNCWRDVCGEHFEKVPLSTYHWWSKFCLYMFIVSSLFFNHWLSLHCSLPMSLNVSTQKWAT